MKIDTNYLREVMRRLIETPSPTGDCDAGIDLCRTILCAIDAKAQIEITRKGDLILCLPGRNQDAPRALTAHIDTLGAVVSRVYDNGRLQLAQLGSYFWSSIENENVSISTADGRIFRGTVLPRGASYHAHLTDSEIDDLNRTAANIEVRIDALTETCEETYELGIRVGDYVHFDTRYEESNGFIKARHLDDKACLAATFAAFKLMQENGMQPHQTSYLQIGTYEEVLHGGACLPERIAELVALDIAPSGEAMNTRETAVSLCVLDKDGPYDRQLSLKLQEIAAANDIELRPGIYARYSSDGKAFWKAGGDARVALFGPGVDATHGYERTHLSALEDTAKLVVAYLMSEH